MTDSLLGTIAGRARAEIEVKKSRFIATLAPVTSADEADAVISAVRTEFYDARHHCTAMVLGSQGHGQRSNDDGEPAGTAGAPMLAVLRGSGLTDVVVVVTRYFGGTLLGAGGLVRAYGQAVSAALAEAVMLERHPVTVLELRAAHEDAGRLENLVRGWLEPQRGELAPGEYDADGARWRALVDDGDVADFGSLLAASNVPHEVAEIGQTITERPARSR